MKLNDLFEALNTQEMLEVNGGGYCEKCHFWHTHGHCQDNGGGGGNTHTPDSDGNDDDGSFNGYDYNSGDYVVDPNWLSEEGWWKWAQDGGPVGHQSFHD